MEEEGEQKGRKSEPGGARKVLHTALSVELNLCELDSAVDAESHLFGRHHNFVVKVRAWCRNRQTDFDRLLIVSEVRENKQLSNFFPVRVFGRRWQGLRQRAVQCYELWLSPVCLRQTFAGHNFNGLGSDDLSLCLGRDCESEEPFLSGGNGCARVLINAISDLAICSYFILGSEYDSLAQPIQNGEVIVTDLALWTKKKK